MCNGRFKDKLSNYKTRNLEHIHLRWRPYDVLSSFQTWVALDGTTWIIPIHLKYLFINASNLYEYYCLYKRFRTVTHEIILLPRNHLPLNFQIVNDRFLTSMFASQYILASDITQIQFFYVSIPSVWLAKKTQKRRTLPRAALFIPVISTIIVVITYPGIWNALPAVRASDVIRGAISRTYCMNSSKIYLKIVTSFVLVCYSVIKRRSIVGRYTSRPLFP